MKRKSQNKPREFEEREFEGRELEGREFDSEQPDVLENPTDDPLFIPPRIVPKDKIYYWVRQAIYNEPDDRRYSMMRRKGWTPVPVSRHPEFAIALKGKDRLDDKGVIEFGGLILCERDKRTCDKEAYERSIEDRRRVNSLSGLDGLPADHHFPVTFQNQMQGTFSDGNSAGFM